MFLIKEDLRDAAIGAAMRAAMGVTICTGAANASRKPRKPLIYTARDAAFLFKTSVGIVTWCDIGPLFILLTHQE